MGYEINDTEITGKINGREHLIQISPVLEHNKASNLHEINILGGVFLKFCYAELFISYRSKTLKIKF